VKNTAVGAYVLASIAGGVVLGLAGGGFGHVLAQAPSTKPILVTLLLLSSVVAIRDRGVPFEVRRQVPRAWTAWNPVSMAAGFGFLLGLGFVTFLETAAMYVLVLGLMASASLPAALAAGAMYGLARSTPTMIRRASITRPRIERPATRKRLSATSGLLAIVIAVALAV
jgi:hypothetical protein